LKSKAPVLVEGEQVDARSGVLDFSRDILSLLPLLFHGLPTRFSLTSTKYRTAEIESPEFLQ
jgi:hypothetical protein